MTRPGYYVGDPPERVPGVTTVISRMRPAEPLMAWAWKEGRDGRDYRDTAQSAADAGTLAHRAVAAHLHGEPWEWPAVDDIARSLWTSGAGGALPEDLAMEIAKTILQRAQVAYGGFLSWQDTSALVCDQTEVRLVSPTYRVGGTFDALLSHGRRVLAEWKTGNALYPEHLVQVRAYGALWEEAHPDQPVEAYILARFDKNTGDFVVHQFTPPLTEAWEAFLTCRRLYDLERACRERLR